MNQAKHQQDKPVIVIGAGGHSKVVIEALVLMKKKIIGVVDANTVMWNKKIFDIPVLGGDELIANYQTQDVDLVCAVAGASVPTIRTEIIHKFSKMGYNFLTIIHPSACVSMYATLGEGVQIMAGAVIQADTKIGNHVIVNTSASIDHDCNIGNFSHIAPGAILSGAVTIGEMTHVGFGSMLKQSVSIGDKTMIGAGSLVITSCGDNEVWFGSPAKRKES